MATTTHGIYYPSSTDQPNGPVQLQTLAESVDDVIAMNSFITITGLASGFAANATFDCFAPAWMLLPTGEVKLRGGIQKSSGNFASGTTEIKHALNSSIIPVHDVEFSVAMSNSGQVTGRVEITGASDANPGQMNLILESSRGTWFSLDSCSYWIA